MNVHAAFMIFRNELGDELSWAAGAKGGATRGERSLSTWGGPGEENEGQKLFAYQLDEELKICHPSFDCMQLRMTAVTLEQTENLSEDL